ncbi:phosphopantetheine-binding protein [Microbacterium enclense]|uniref:phosphopantetheine-binding protein n=1 Tax=Microbacterium enclense TaxID=993073 RepID=UPI003F808709
MVSNERDELMAVIASVFAPAEVSMDSTLNNFGASSLLLLRLISALQRRFGVVLDVAELFSAEDISEWSSSSRRDERRTPSSLTEPTPTGSRLSSVGCGSVMSMPSDHRRVSCIQAECRRGQTQLCDTVRGDEQPPW